MFHELQNTWPKCILGKMHCRATQNLQWLNLKLLQLPLCWIPLSHFTDCWKRPSESQTRQLLITETQQHAAEQNQNVRDANLYVITNLYIEFNVNKIYPPNTVFHLLHDINKLKGYHTQVLVPKERKGIYIIDILNKYGGKRVHVVLNFINVYYLVNSAYLQVQGSSFIVSRLLESRLMGMICLTFQNDGWKGMW